MPVTDSPGGVRPGARGVFLDGLRRLPFRAMTVGLLVLLSPAISLVNRQSVVEIRLGVALAEEELPAVSKLLDRFSALSGVRAVLTSIDATALPGTIEEQQRAEKKSVHLFAQDNVALTVLLERGLVQDVSAIPIPDEVIPQLRNMPGSRLGRSAERFFLPFRPNVRLMYANRQCLDDVGASSPTTAAQLLDVGRQLKEAAARPRLTFSLKPWDPAAVTLSELVLSFGGDPLQLTSQGAGEAFSFLQRLWTDGLLAENSWQGDFASEVRNLEDGSSCVVQNWSYTSAQLSKAGRLPEFVVSAGWAGPAGRYSVVGGDVLGIPKGITGKEREGASALARFLMSREAQEALVQENGWPSIRGDAYGTVRRECGGGGGLQCGPWLAAARPSELFDTFATIQAALEQGWHRPSVKEWQAATFRLNAAACRVTVHREPVDAVLAEVQGIDGVEHLRAMATCSGG